MVKTIDQIISDIIKREGGYVDHPADRGGATKYGVTLNTLSVYRGKQCTKDDVKNLDKREAAEIFFKNYFSKPGLIRLPSQIHPIMLDMSVIYGPTKAIKLLQRSLNLLEDGVIGPKTIDASNKAVQKGILIEKLVFERKRFHQQIVANNPSQKVFLAGWNNRADEFV